MISFELPISPSINHYFGRRGKFSYLPKEVKQYRAAVQDIVTEAGHPTLDGRVAVFIAIHMPSRRRSDIDNRVKGCLDALTHAGVWLDDSQVDALTVVRRGVIKGGLVKVVIAEIDDSIEPHDAAIEAIHGDKETQ